MPRNALLQTRVEPTTAARVRLRATQTGLSVSEWMAGVVRREVLRQGSADALAQRSYEMLATIGYMLRALMVDSMGLEKAEQAIAEASAAAAEDAEAELRRALELP